MPSLALFTKEIPSDKRAPLNENGKDFIGRRCEKEIPL
jgi:hypothetical protein